MNHPKTIQAEQLDRTTREFYVRAMTELERAAVPYLVGGGYAMACLTGIERQTKDLDLFVRSSDVERALELLGALGYHTERTWPHFLVKVIHKTPMSADKAPAFIDILHNSGNGLCPVDDDWFAHAREAQLMGLRIPLCPPEEMIWSKGYVQERDRFDGADVVHLVYSCGQDMDWSRLLGRFRDTEAVLLAHLLLYGFVYPSERQRIPGWVMHELWNQTRPQADPDPHTAQRICRGTILSQSQYEFDIEQRGYIDGRLRPVEPVSGEVALL
jgi:hypothetical protein